MSEEVKALIIVVGMLAGPVISWAMGYSEGYKLGRRMGRVEGVVRDFKCPKMEMHEDGDAE